MEYVQPADQRTARLKHRLLKEAQIGEILGISAATLRRWRLLQRGPKYIKIGGAVRYRPEDVTAWLATRPTGGEQVHGRFVAVDQIGGPGGGE
jgi:predicted DNA-binding transcriptional regulator AlpA